MSHFATLLSAIAVTISLAGAGLAILARIAWRIGQLAERWDAHISQETRLWRKVERRFAKLEKAQRREKRA